jgi:flagellar biosynthesis GTPase FlhF
MSTTTPEKTNGHGHDLDGVRTYRARKLEDLIPQIRADLGPDAIILRQREGLTGGVGGFFAQRCVEVEAQPAPAKVDILADDELELDEPEPTQVAEEVAVTPTPVAADRPAEQTPADEAPAGVDEDSLFESFAASLEEAAAHVGDMQQLAAAVDVDLPEPTTEPEPAPEPEPELVLPEAETGMPESATPEPIVVARPQQAFAAKQAGVPEAEEISTVIAELSAQGISHQWAHELVVAAAAHRSPLTAQASLRDAVRATLAATIPAPAPLPATGAAVGFVGTGGAGKTRCAAALSRAYAQASTLAASVVSLASSDWGSAIKDLLRGENVWVTVAPGTTEAASAIASGRDGGLVVIDTAAVSPADPSAVAALAAELEPLQLDAIYIAVPATFSVHAAQKLVDGLEALGADGIAVTHADEADQLGIAAELAYLSGMPIAYIHHGLDGDQAMHAADPASLAARLLP